MQEEKEYTNEELKKGVDINGITYKVTEMTPIATDFNMQVNNKEEWENMEAWEKQLRAEFIPMFDLANKELSPTGWDDRVVNFIKQTLSKREAEIRDKILNAIEVAEPLRIEGESPEFTQGQEWTIAQFRMNLESLLQSKDNK